MRHTCRRGRLSLKPVLRLCPCFGRLEKPSARLRLDPAWVRWPRRVRRRADSRTVTPTPGGRLTVAQGVDFGVFGKTPELLFGEGELAVDGDLEHTARALNELDLGAVLFFELRPRTEGPGKVVSRNAVFDPDLHRRVSFRENDGQSNTPAGLQPFSSAIASSVYNGAMKRDAAGMSPARSRAASPTDG